jgi:hypothetical protein
MLAGARPPTALELEPHPRRTVQHLVEVRGELGERRVKVVVLLDPHLHVVVGVLLRRLEVLVGRRVEVDGRDEVLRAGQDVLPLAAETVLRQVLVERANEDAPVLLGDQVLDLLPVGGDGRIGRRSTGRLPLEHHSTSS